MKSPRRTLALLLLAPAFALGACGGGKSDKDKITDIVKSVDKDSSTLCDHATTALLAKVGGTVDKCKTTARGYPNTDHIKGDIAVAVNGNSATADFTTEKGQKNHVTFVKDGSDWKIDTSTSS
ncbi:MAG: hypothetical protein JWM73_2750 [Solirubrobacterales bacterium]|jgi:hypothetical protein|nr:hypothetical protein [Solirubrobacterales bacterium]